MEKILQKDLEDETDTAQEHAKLMKQKAVLKGPPGGSKRNLTLKIDRF